MSLPAFIARLGGLLAATVTLLATASAMLGAEPVQAAGAAPDGPTVVALAPSAGV
jgi:hypothetical protein